jgi:hypothetical protein
VPEVLSRGVAAHTVGQVVVLTSGGEVLVDAVTLLGSEGTGGEVKPLAISHTPMNSSQRPPGMAWIEFRLKPRTCSTDPDRRIA